MRSNCLFQVELSFLFVGHTHEAVDRFFFWINRNITKKGDLFSTPELLACIQDCNHDVFIKIEELLEVANWKDWLKPACVQLHNHTGKGSMHHWKWSRDVEGGPVMLRYRYNCTEEWVPLEGLSFLKQDSIPDIKDLKALKLIPLEPAMMKDISKLESRLSDVFDLTPEVTEWWRGFVQRAAAVADKDGPAAELVQSFPVRTAPIVNELDVPVGGAEVQDQILAELGVAGPKEPYTGAYQTPGRREGLGVNYDDIKVGDFVIIRNEKDSSDEADWFLAKLVMNDTVRKEIKVCWWEVQGKAGVYFSSLVMEKNSRGKDIKVDHEQWVPLQSVLLFGFDLNKGGRKNGGTITAAVKKRINEMFAEALDEEYEKEVANDAPSAYQGPLGSDASTDEDDMPLVAKRSST